MRFGSCTHVVSTVLAALGLFATLPSSAAKAAEPVVVYSARNEQLIKPIFDRFTAETGIPVRFTTADAAVLIERLAAEERTVRRICS